jgi:hypothetical membrane protein
MGTESIERPFERVLLASGIVGPLVLWTVSLALGAVTPGFDPVRRSISALANAPLGGLQALAFVVSGLLEVGFGLAVAGRLVGGSGARRLTTALFVALGVLTVLFALFPTDPPGVPRSAVGRVHLSLALLAAVALPATCLSVAILRKREGRSWRGTFLVGALLVASFPLLVLAVSGPLRPYLGLVERLYFALPSAWQANVAWSEMRGHPRGRRTPA